MIAMKNLNVPPSFPISLLLCFFYSNNLALLAVDNGVGIDPAVVNKGKNGHFGLRGMRERADRIGGTFTTVSSSNLGTEIKVVVPGWIVFWTETRPLRWFKPRQSVS